MAGKEGHAQTTRMSEAHCRQDRISTFEQGIVVYIEPLRPDQYRNKSLGTGTIRPDIPGAGAVAPPAPP